MSKLFESEIKDMQRLINYGMTNNEKPKTSSYIVEYHAKGADGKTYGIIRECDKFYIKVAPKKDTEVLAEDYDYIGGFNNRKQNEFLTYNSAAKQFDIKMRSLNEAYSKETSYERFKPTQPSDWQINETKEMRSEINRFHQIVNNVAGILNESVNECGCKGPFCENADPDEKFEGKEENNPKKAGKLPEEKGKKCTSYPFCNDATDTESGNRDKGKKKAEKEKRGCSKENGKGALCCSKKRHNIKINEEQVLAWSRSKDFIDKTHGTHIGSSSPYTIDADDSGLNDKSDYEPLRESEGIAVHNTDNLRKPKPGTSEPGDSYPYDEEVNEAVMYIVEMDDALPDDGTIQDTPEYELELNDSPTSEFLDNPDNVGDDIDDIDDIDGIDGYADAVADDEGDEYELELDDKDKPVTDAEVNSPDKAWLNPTKDEKEDEEIANYEPSNDEINSIGTEYADDPYWGNETLDSLLGDEDDYLGDLDLSHYTRRGRAMNEMVLNDFGKHPAYQKRVMTLPPNTEINRFGRDWNHESAKGEKPYGTKIGSSYPYTEELVDKIANSVMNKIYKKKA